MTPVNPTTSPRIDAPSAQWEPAPHLPLPSWPNSSYGPIYMDCHATTPLDPLVVEAMWPFLTQHFGNSGSGHAYGWAAKAAVDQAREILAAALNASPEEIVFTSGATESNNLAIKGIAETHIDKGRHIITVVTEHPAVLDPCRYLESLGFEVTLLPVQPDGLVDLELLAQSIRSDTILVSVMLANNEIGVLQPIAEIGAICRDRGVLFHTDAAQAIGKVPIDVQAMNVDLMSLTAHKVYGPKGIGALYVRQSNPHVRLAPQLHGGGQEGGRRAGTLFIPQIVGFGRAVELGLAQLEEETTRTIALRQRLWDQISAFQSSVPMHLNGHPTQRLPGNLNVTIEGVRGEDVLAAVQEVAAVSSSSACQSTKVAKGKLSHVLRAIGRVSDPNTATIRYGIGRFHTPEDIDRVARATLGAIDKCRAGAAWY